LFASGDETARFPFFRFGNFHRFEFVSDFGFRISDFRLRRAVFFAPLRLKEWSEYLARVERFLGIALQRWRRSAEAPLREGRPAHEAKYF
jgi:hypothetical protein